MTQNDKSSEKISIALTVLGILIAISFGFYGVYSTINLDKTDVSFEILNDANVLDIHKPLEDLIISFKGDDIQEENLNLRIITIRIKNTGNVNVLQSYFDNNDIWGIQGKNCEFLEVRFIEENSDYLKTNLEPKLIENNTIKFNKIIFEKGNYFILEILVFHDKDEIPEFIPIGKIAGVDEILPIKLSENMKLARNENKGPNVNATIIGGIVLMAMCVALISLIDSVLEKPVKIIQDAR